MRNLTPVFLLMLSLLPPVNALAADRGVIDEWASVQPPPPPSLNAVEIDIKSTALLVLDLAAQTCNEETRPRCVAMIPKIHDLLVWARQKQILVIYTLGAASKPADILPAIAMLGDEPIVTAPPDKFLGTDLAKILREKSIRTVITVGASSHGAVLFTAAGAAFRGYDVIVPVDGMAGNNAYADQLTAWELVNGPRLPEKVTLTSLKQLMESSTK